jgi:predicted regulator of Ras-like GTPase activity (Roadblock/LC7/MglB family)
MKHGCSIVAAVVLVLSLCSAALAQVSYPPAMAAEASPYPGAAVAMAGKDANAIQAMLTTPDAPEKVVAHYRSQLTSKGWEVAQEMEMPQVRTISFERGESTFTVAAMPQGDGRDTMITLVLEAK